MRRLSAGIVVAILGAAVSGCGFLEVGPVVGCDLKSVDNVHESRGTPGSMDGKAKVSCNGALSNLTFEMHGQKLVSGAFVTKYTNSVKYAPAKASKVYTGMWVAPCQSGTWRTKMRTKGTYKGQVDVSDWKYSNETKNPCG